MEELMKTKMELNMLPPDSERNIKIFPLLYSENIFFFNNHKQFFFHET